MIIQDNRNNNLYAFKLFVRTSTKKVSVGHSLITNTTGIRLTNLSKKSQ